MEKFSNTGAATTTGVSSQYEEEVERGIGIGGILPFPLLFLGISCCSQTSYYSFIHDDDDDNIQNKP